MNWTSPAEVRRSLVYALPALVVTAVAGALHAETWITLVSDTWQGEGYGHGPLLAAIAIVLLLRQRGGRVTGVQASPSWMGILATLAVLVIWETADLVSVQGVQQACAFLVGFTAIWAIRGAAAARALAFPLLIPLAAISLWDLAFAPLQDAAVVLSRIGVRAIGIPAYFDENFITIPNGVFVIETVCAGLSYVLAGMTFALLYGHLYLRRRLSRWSFVLLTVSWVVVLNAVRVVVVVMFGHVSGMDHPAVRDHGEIGWGIFAVGLLPLIWFGGRLERWEGATGADQSEKPASGPFVTAARRALMTTAWLLAVTILLATGVRVLERRELPLAEVSIGESRPCEVAELADRGWQPRFTEAAHASCRVIEGGREIDVYVAQFPRERPGEEMIGYGSSMHGASESDLLSLNSSGGYLEALHRDANGRLRLTLWRYRIGATWTTSGMLAKILRVPTLLFGLDAPIAVGASLPVGGTEADPERTLLRDALSERVHVGDRS